MSVARSFGRGWPKPQITSNDVNRNYRKSGARYRRIEDLKLWPVLALNQDFSQRRGFKP